jgi:hypothetical protein
MSDTLDLNCWILGADAGQVFLVKILKTATVGTLKKVIKEEKKVALQHVDADALSLWKVSIPVDRRIKEKVKVKDEQVLLSVKRLSHLFENQPDDQHLHIVVQFPRHGAELSLAVTYFLIQARL